MTKEEQETVITWDNSTCMMQVYTADPALMRRLRGLQSYKLIREHRQGDGKVIAAVFEAEKRLLTLRSKAPTSNMSEEQRAAARERLQEYHKQKKAI